MAFDADSPTLTYRVVVGTAHGTLVLNSDGTFTYAPDEHFAGDDSFTFRASDGSLESNLGHGHDHGQGRDATEPHPAS